MHKKSMTEYPRALFDRAGNGKYFLIDPPDPYLYDCQNCGGIGELSIFIVSKGPFNYVPPTPGGEVLKSVEDSQYGWIWYTGKVFDAPCQVCRGLGKSQDIKKQVPASGDYFEKFVKADTDAIVAKMSSKKVLRD